MLDTRPRPTPSPNARAVVARRRADRVDEELVARWRLAAQRSRQRRELGRRRQRGRRRRRHIVLVLVGCAALAAIAIETWLASDDGDAPSTAAAGTASGRFGPAQRKTAAPGWPSGAYPPASRVRSATRFAASSPGLVSFAVIDSAGGLRGHAANRQYVSASAVKALLLAAELGRLERERLPLDPLTEQMLKSMITISDNDAADEIYYRVGDDGLYSVARRAGMANFEVSGYWANAQLTAADMARFFLGLEHNLVGPHRRFAKRLLAGIVSYQRWGVPAAAGKRWRVWFKGGWRATGLGQLAHQAALLRAKDGRRLGLAVLTDGQPSQEMAIEAIAEVTRRLLARDRPSWRWAA